MEIQFYGCANADTNVCPASMLEVGLSRDTNEKVRSKSIEWHWHESPLSLKIHMKVIATNRMFAKNVPFQTHTHTYTNTNSQTKYRTNSPSSRIYMYKVLVPFSLLACIDTSNRCLRTLHADCRGEFLLFKCIATNLIYFRSTYT